MQLKNEVIKLLKKEIKSFDDNLLETPPNSEMGDYALPCFFLSKTLKKDPKSIAKELSTKLKPNLYIKKIINIGPYINFFINNEIRTKNLLERINKEKDKYGSNNSGKNKSILIEHTSINPNASPHMGRARNAIIGDFIVRIHKFENYKVETHYFVNDVGKQISMLVLASKGKKPTFDQLLSLYVNFNKRLEKNPKLEGEVFELLNKLEKGDKTVKKQFESIVNICIKGQTEILNKLDIKYDYFDKESQYLWKKSTTEYLKKLEKTKKIFTDEHGRKVLDLKGYDLPMKSPVFVLTRNDGTSLYQLRDIAYTIDKVKKSKNNLVILGEDHKLYFQQLSITLELLKQSPPRAIFYTFILLKEKGKMSTRKGTVILLDELIKESEKRALEEVNARNKKSKQNKKIADIIAHGAIKFSILKVSPEKNITFDLEEALSFEGDTSLYVQYAYTRANSILKDAKVTKDIDYSLLQKPEETRLITLLESFPEKVEQAIKNYHSQTIVSYSLDLAHAFNEFYQQCPCNTEEDKEIKKARLLLVFSTKQVLKNSLSILGIKCPEFM
ncbi:MAG: arginine--tRNA ligase [archaeon]